MKAEGAGLFGAVEGFYGKPWTPGQRGTLFKWLEAGGLNAYLYAPKDDARHRAWWREPYEADEAEGLRRLVGEARAYGVRLVYALAPGLDLRFSDAEDLAALESKLKQVHGFGVTDFAVLFDDIRPDLSRADEERFGTPAAAQAFVGNAVWEWAQRWTPGARVLFCPTEYCGRFAEPTVSESPYLRTLGERLVPGVDVLWTGPEIISEEIPVDSLREVARVLRRKPVLWDNLHANDYDMRRLYLGPYAGRSGEVLGAVRGILQNPNCQFEANFIPVRTLAAYVREGPAYRPRAAYDEALGAWHPHFRSRGGPGLALDDLRLAADLFYLPTEHGERAERYLADLRVVLQTPPNSWGEVAVRLEETTRQIIGLYDRLTELADRGLMHALYAHIWEVKEQAILVGEWGRWRQRASDPEARFRSAGFRPRLYRGGFSAALERLLPMDEEGYFHPGRPR